MSRLVWEVASYRIFLSGTYGNETGLEREEDCEECPPGHYCEDGSILPEPCPAGTYRNEKGGKVRAAECTSVFQFTHVPTRYLITRAIFWTLKI